MIGSKFSYHFGIVGVRKDQRKLEKHDIEDIPPPKETLTAETTSTTRVLNKFALRNLQLSTWDMEINDGQNRASKIRSSPSFIPEIL